MKFQPKKTVYIVTRAAVVAALYVALTFVFSFMSFGPVQFRISEVLTVLPLIFPEAVIGLTVGCALANLMNSPIDAALGSAATLAASLITLVIGIIIRPNSSRSHILRFSLGAIPPILVNALVVPLIILMAAPDFSMGYFADFGFVLLGQLAVIASLGTPFYFGLVRLGARHPDLLGDNLLNRKADCPNQVTDGRSDEDSRQ